MFERKKLSELIGVPEEHPTVTLKKKIASGYEKGWIKIGDRVLFVRSRWEANLCAYFEWLKLKGSISKWGYESKTFWFDKIKRGVTNYKPDFLIIENDGTEIYIEVKGFWTPKDTVKMNRMRVYYPFVKIQILANAKAFEKINKDFPDLKYTKYSTYEDISKWSSLIPNWNTPFLSRSEIEHLIPIKTKKVKNE